jgi:hypothetical protein
MSKKNDLEFRLAISINPYDIADMQKKANSAQYLSDVAKIEIKPGNSSLYQNPSREEKKAVHK